MPLGAHNITHKSKGPKVIKDSELGIARLYAKLHFFLHPSSPALIYLPSSPSSQYYVTQVYFLLETTTTHWYSGIYTIEVYDGYVQLQHPFLPTRPPALHSGLVAMKSPRVFSLSANYSLFTKREQR